MTKQTLKTEKAVQVKHDDSDFEPKYLGKDYKVPETFIRRAEEMKIFLALNPIPEQFLPKRKEV